jgi:hypothetical protein
MFGGSGNSGNLADTWEWDGTLWAQVATTGPPARSYASMAYDSARGRNVLFGGLSTGGRFADTWEWDGSLWTQVAGIGPTARSDAALAYDNTRGRTVLFGGQSSVGVLSDTWEYGTFHVVTVPDAVSALRISSGIAAAGSDTLKTLDAEKTGVSAGRVEILDAIRIARKAAGLDANP